MAASVITARIVGDVSDLKAKMGQVQGETAKTASGMKRLGGAIGTAFAGAGIARLGAFVTELGQVAAESKKLEAQTEVLTKGNKKAMATVDRLSNSLKKKLVVDDEAIRMSQNQLLSFTSLNKAASEQPKLFERITKANADVTATIEGGLPSQAGLTQGAIRLGKALEDPIKGLGALSRVGVIFTAEQKAQIKVLAASTEDIGKYSEKLDKAKDKLDKMAAAGKQNTPEFEKLSKMIQLKTAHLDKMNASVEGGTGKLAAQELILKAIEDQYQGSAEAAGKNASATDKLNIVLGDLKEKLGGAIGGLGPVIQMTGNLGMTIGPLLTVFPALTAKIAAFGVTVGSVALIVGSLTVAVKALSESLPKIARALTGGGKFSTKDLIRAAVPGARFIPGLAHGGIVTSPTLAMIGEAGPEAVVPLRRGGRGGAGLGGAPVVNVFLDGREMQNTLVRIGRRNGGSALGAFA